MKVKRLVVKVGTSTLTRPSGRLDRARVERLAEEMATLRSQGREVVLVSSGAIAAGLESLGMRKRPSDLPTLQAAASIGQGKLMELYASVFKEQGLLAGQVLLTQYDMTHRQQYLNARHTLCRLLELGAVPVINENDTVAVEEIRFGDNDRLAALVAGMVEADLLAILTDIKGLFTADPRAGKGAELIRRVEKITPEIEGLADGTSGGFATGGMVTKMQAAKIATLSGTGVIILDGRKKRIVSRVLGGAEEGTYFPPRRSRMTSRKRWIAFGLKPAGTLRVDDGAARAILEKGKSLLPAGVTEVSGEFGPGEMVEVVDGEGRALARGLVSYASEELDAIKGMRSREAARLLGGECQEAIHRDCLVVLER